MSFIELDSIKERELVAGFKAKFVHSEKMTISFFTIKAGSTLPEHSHPHEQISNVIEGEFEMVVDGESRVLTPGIVTVIPSDSPHSGTAKTDCRIIDIFHPVRQDYKFD
ncbi:cupin domain-containing protein [Desulfobacterales bacterium HSG16]|nr:cupin domain-containing protein [Desulfobacterales bacterium HSG16]